MLSLHLRLRARAEDPLTESRDRYSIRCAYPSRLAWRVGTSALAARAFLGSALALAPPMAAASAQVSTPATPQVGVPTQPELVGPPAPPPTADLPLLAPREGPLPATLTLEQALEEAAARSPAVIAAQARVEAAEARENGRASCRESECQ